MERIVLHHPSDHTKSRVLEPGFGKGLGIALKNVDDRLKGYFGPCCGLRVESGEGAGTRVTLTIALAPDT